jgi:peptide/nickel transport system substrate-binding protein
MDKGVPGRAGVQILLPVPSELYHDAIYHTREGNAMPRLTFAQLYVTRSLARALLLCVALTSSAAAQAGPKAAPTPADTAPVKRLVFVSAGFSESNRFWIIDRPAHLQFDPFLETLLDVDPETGAYIPRLAERWESSPDLKEWTFYLRKGVPFHFGFGEFTARDVVHAHSLMLRSEATATLSGFWRTVEEIKVVNDYQVVFRMKQPSATMPYAASRAGDLRIVSKAQWDKEGLEGFDKRPAGTGSYQYLGRQLGQSIFFARVDNHWGGDKPAFPELEIRLAREDATRLALLLNGEAHIVDLPRELQPDALKRGMQVLSSKLATDWLTVYFGGQFHVPGDPKFKAGIPWNDKRVRQALNMAVNRKEIIDTIFRGKGSPMYVSGYQPFLEGWDPSWAERFTDLYGYNPAKARALLKEAGYAPGAINVNLFAYTSPGEAEHPQIAEALAIYFDAVGVKSTIETLDEGKVASAWRNKETTGYIWPNIIGLRPTEEWIRISYWSKGTVHHFEDEFIDKKYLELTKSIDPQERERLAREIGNHLFESFADMPIILLYNEVVANPKVVSAWTYPGTGAGRSTHFHLLKPAR